MLQYNLKFNNQPEYLAEDLIISQANEEAVNYIDNWPDWGFGPYTKILVIYGNEGCGKTHIAHLWQKRSNAYFINHNDQFSKLPSDLFFEPACYIIEDIENISDEIAFFHLLNSIIEHKRYLLLTCSTAPNLLNISLPDLKSRINAFYSIEIGKPDDDLLRAVLVKNFSDKQLRINTEVINYALAHIDRSFSAAKKLVDLLDNKSLNLRKNITISVVREVIKEIENGGPDWS